jgi:hypothetical protein
LGALDCHRQSHSSPAAQACDEICPQFGFQPSSVHNQRENVLMLAANIYKTIPLEAKPGEGKGRASRAATALHAHTLGTYENWALNMHGIPTRAQAYSRQMSQANPRGADGFEGVAPEERMKTEVYEVVLPDPLLAHVNESQRP